MAKSSNLWLIVVCCLSQFIHTVYGSVANIALPAISKEFGGGIGSLPWIVNAYVLALASLLTFSGTLADRFGRKRILLLGNIVMIAGAIVCAVSPDVSLLITGRALQGVGSALIAPAGLALLTDAFPALAKRAIAVMWWTAIGTASLAAGPILGGMLVANLSWRAVFWAGVPLGIVAVVLGFILLRESRAAVPGRFDPLGQILLTLLLCAFAFALTEGARLGWASPTVVVAAVVAVVSMVAFVAYERRHPEPLIEISLFAERSFTTALVTAILGFLSIAGLLFLNTFYLQAERGLDAATAGFLTIPLALGATITAVLAARLVARGHSRLALIAAGSLIALGAVTLWATEHGELWMIVLPYFVFGLGFGLIADPISVTALAALPNAKRGLASSLISTSKQVGQLLGIAGVGALLAIGATSTETDSSEFHDMGGWGWGLLLAAGLTIVILNVTAPKVPATA